MNEGINIHQDDILWRFYCKCFLVEGKEVEPPKNLCRYFWTSVKGFGLWLGREVKLRSLWLIVLVVTAILFAVARAIPYANNTVTTTLVGTVIILWSFALLTAMFATVYRVKRMVNWAMYLLGFCALILDIVLVAALVTLWPEELTRFFDLLRWMGYMLMVMMGVIVIRIIFSTIPHRRLQKLQRVLQIFDAFVSAKKSRVCPLINPPEGFKAKP